MVRRLLFTALILINAHCVCSAAVINRPPAYALAVNRLGVVAMIVSAIIAILLISLLVYGRSQNKVVINPEQTEQSLIQNQAGLHLIVDSAPVLIWSANHDMLCSYLNKEWLRFTGRSIQGVSGDAWLHDIHPDDMQIFRRAFDSRESFTIEHRLRRFDGEYRWMRNNAVPQFVGTPNFAGYIGCCVDITEERDAKAFQAEFGSRLIRAQEEERARIARELHDDINQRLALLANGLDKLGRERKEDSKAELAMEICDLWQLTNEIATDIQNLSHRLHPSKLHYLGLAAAVRDLCREFSRQHNIEVDCNVSNLPRDLDEDISLCLFRTFQEALRNIAKHSHAHHAKVELTHQYSIIRLRVSDDGVGFVLDSFAKEKGLGLVSMRERLKSAGGQFGIWSRPSFGTQIEGTIPAAPKRSAGASSIS